MKRDSETGPRQCGWDEAALFDLVDDALPPEQKAVFEDHLRQCRSCQADLQSYLKLERDLDELPSLPARADFDDRVLEAVLGTAAPAEAGRRTWPRERWFNIGWAPRRLVGVFSAAAALLVAGGVLEVAGAGGWRALTAQIISGMVRGGVDLLNGGVGRLLTAIRISDVFLNLAGIFQTLLRSIAATVHAAGAEFWLISTLLSLLALMGAVRLATGSAVERGIGRVHFIL